MQCTGLKKKNKTTHNNLQGVPFKIVQLQGVGRSDHYCTVRYAKVYTFASFAELVKNELSLNISLRLCRIRYYYYEQLWYTVYILSYFLWYNKVKIIVF